MCRVDSNVRSAACGRGASPNRLHDPQIGNHESPRTTKLYDRKNDVSNLDEIERILILNNFFHEEEYLAEYQTPIDAYKAANPTIPVREETVHHRKGIRWDPNQRMRC